MSRSMIVLVLSLFPIAARGPAWGAGDSGDSSFEAKLEKEAAAVKAKTQESKASLPLETGSPWPYALPGQPYTIEQAAADFARARPVDAKTLAGAWFETAYAERDRGRREPAGINSCCASALAFDAGQVRVAAWFEEDLSLSGTNGPYQVDEQGRFTAYYECDHPDCGYSWWQDHYECRLLDPNQLVCRKERDSGDLPTWRGDPGSTNPDSRANYLVYSRKLTRPQ